MRRHEFIMLIGGVAGWPLAARAQQLAAKLPRIGIIDEGPALDHFRLGQRDFGYIKRPKHCAISYGSSRKEILVAIVG